MPRPLRRSKPRLAATPASLSPSSLLQLIWLASPALPVGGFSYSEVLEPAVDSGRVHDEASARAWLLDHLALVWQRSEAPLLASAWRAWQRHDAARIAELNAWVLQTRETHELRQQAEQMGRSLADWLRQRQPADRRVATLTGLAGGPTWPLAFALAVQAGSLHPAPLREALLACGFGWAENLVAAAIKAVPLGQSAGQRLLQALADALPAAVDAALVTSQLGDAGRFAFAPMLAILSSQHEAQYSRLFRS